MNLVDRKTLISNMNHTHSKLGIFIENELKGDDKKSWREGEGKFQAAKQKYLKLYEEINTTPLDTRTLDMRAWDLIEDLGNMDGKVNDKTWSMMGIYIPRKIIWKMLLAKFSR